MRVQEAVHESNSQKRLLQKTSKVFDTIRLLNQTFLYLSRFIPESLRWNISKGRIKEAAESARKIAKFNKIGLADDLNIKAPVKSKEDQNARRTVIGRLITVLTTTKVLRRRAFCLFYVW